MTKQSLSEFGNFNKKLRAFIAAPSEHCQSENPGHQMPWSRTTHPTLPTRARYAVLTGARTNQRPVPIQSDELLNSNRDRNRDLTSPLGNSST